MPDQSRAAWRKPKPATALLKSTGAPLTVGPFLALLELAGLIEWREYVSSTGSGEIKRFRRLNAAGLAYGINEANSWTVATDCLFYRENFPDLLRVAARALGEFADRIPR